MKKLPAVLLALLLWSFDASALSHLYSGAASTQVPSAPIGLVPVSGATNGTVNPFWAANPASDSVTSYKLFRATGANQACASASLVNNANVLSFADSGMTAGASYTYCLKATNAAGDSAFGPAINATAGQQTCGLVGGKTPDGCAIGPVANGSTSTTFTDVNGNTFVFGCLNGNPQCNNVADGALLLVNGTAFGHDSTLQINSSGQAFIGDSCPTWGHDIWSNNTHQLVALAPTIPLGTPMHDTTQNLQFNNFDQAMQGGSGVQDGDSFEIVVGASAGIVQGNAFRITHQNISIQIDDGVWIGCNVSEGNAILKVDTTGSGTGRIDGLSITLKGNAQLSYAYGTDLVAIDPCGSTTITGDPNATVPEVHDNGFGDESCNGKQDAVFTASASGTTLTVTAITSGTIHVNTGITSTTNGDITFGNTIVSQLTGTTGGTGTYQLQNSASAASESMTTTMDGQSAGQTITNFWAEHNGTTGGNPEHNFYTGAADSVVNYTGTRAACTQAQGFQIKNRSKNGGTWTQGYAVGVSLSDKFTDCNGSAAIDITCGGGPFVISHYVIEKGFNDDQGGNPGRGVIWVGDNRNGFCETDYTSTSITLDTDIIIDDFPGDANGPDQRFLCPGFTACAGFTGTRTYTIKNSMIIGNANMPTVDAAHFASLFPDGTIDGGGNTYYQTRALAQAANPTMALGPCTGVRVSQCPIPHFL